MSKAVLAAASIVGLLPLLAAASTFPLKRIPMLTYVVDYEASWSPNGRQIVLISNRHGGMHVHVVAPVDADHGSKMLQITNGDAEDDSPAWSPDGSEIAFVSVRRGASHIYVMNADGRNVRQVTTGSGQEIHPAWSPDGSRILFDTTLFQQTDRSGTPTAKPNDFIGETSDYAMDLATIRPDGTDLARITRGGGFTYASFSPDGRTILYRRQRRGESQIFVMGRNDLREHNLSGSFTSDGWPSWSPDGARIVFSRHLTNGFQIFVMNRDGSAPQQLTDASGEFTNPRWSPDGTSILCGRRWGGAIGLVLFPAPGAAKGV
ncbi:MAG: hypothetical protein WCB01_04720 [Candidatus Cybelea sp.]